MADDIVLNAGSGGDTIKADEDVGGKKHQYVKVEFGADNTQTPVDATNPLPIEPGTGVTFAASNDDTVSTNNSTTSTLGIGANFTGTGDDRLGYSSVTILIKSDVDSATDGMTFQFSSDNSNWDDTSTFTYLASEGSRRFQFSQAGRYFRVNYTNGGTGQGSFRVQTILHRQSVLTSIHRLDDDISPDRSATLVKAVIAAQSAGSGDYMVVQATASGNFKVSLQEVNGVEMPTRGTVAHDSPDTADAPLKMGGVATTSEPAAVANADLVNAYFDTTGHQHVKVDTLPAANLGQRAMAASLSIVPANNITDATYIGDIKFGEAEPNSAAIKTATEATQAAVEIMDDWDETNRAAVNTIAGQVGIAANAGVMDALTSRITIATNDTQFGAIGSAADFSGNVHGQLGYIAENIDEVHVPVDEMSATASWAASTDAAGIAQESDHVPTHGVTNSLSIDKTGTATTEASYGKALGATVDGSVLAGDGTATFYVRHANYTNVTAVFIRIGADAANYMEFAVDPVEFSTTLWSQVVVALHEGTQTGTGLDLANIDYVAFGVTMTAQGNTISNVFFNAVELHSVGAAELTVSSDVTASAVRVSKIGSNSNQTVATGAGAVTTGVQRNTLASDDPAVVALELIDDAIYVDDAAWTDNTSKHILVGGIYEGAPQTVTDGSTAPIQLDNTGHVVESFSEATNTAVELMDDVVAILGTATYTETTTKGNVIGAVRNDDLATLANTDNEIAPVQVDAEGAVFVNLAASEPKRASGVAASGTTAIITAVAARKFRILAMTLTATSATATNVHLATTTDTDVWGNAGNPIPMAMDADGDNIAGVVWPYNPAGYTETSTANEALNLILSAAQDIAWTITWIEVP